MASVLVGTAAVAATGSAAAIPATAGLFGAAGSFGIAQTLMTAGIMGGLAGSVMSMGSQVDAGEYQARQTEAQAVEAERVAAYNADAKRDQYRKLLGTQKASYGASGVQLDAGGTPSDVLAQTHVDMEMDALSTYYDGTGKGAAYRNQAQAYRNKAQANSTATMFEGIAATGRGAYSLLR